MVDRDANVRKLQGNRLRRARIAAGYSSARAAALANHWPEATYRSHENGFRTIGLDDAERYARRFRAAGVKVSGQTILYDQEGGAVPVVPLLTWDIASALADAGFRLPVDDVPLLAAGELGAGEFFGLRVEGDAMNRLSHPGSIIIVNRADRELVREKSYVFCLRGEPHYRRWQPEPPFLEPWSTNPTHRPIFINRKKDLEVIGRVWRTVLDL